MGRGVPEAGRQCYNSPMNSDLSGTRTRTTRTTRTRPRMPSLGRTLDRGPTNIRYICKTLLSGCSNSIWSWYHLLPQTFYMFLCSPTHNFYISQAPPPPSPTAPSPNPLQGSLRTRQTSWAARAQGSPHSEATHRWLKDKDNKKEKSQRQTRASLLITIVLIFLYWPCWGSVSSVFRPKNTCSFW